MSNVTHMKWQPSPLCQCLGHPPPTPRHRGLSPGLPSSPSDHQGGTGKFPLSNSAGGLDRRRPHRAEAGTAARREPREAVSIQDMSPRNWQQEQGIDPPWPWPGVMTAQGGRVTASLLSSLLVTPRRRPTVQVFLPLVWAHLGDTGFILKQSEPQFARRSGGNDPLCLEHQRCTYITSEGVGGPLGMRTARVWDGGPRCQETESR